VVIGLTGGICTGKSTVGRMFEELGARLIDADELAHEAIRKGTNAHQEITATFGPVIVAADGEIDRQKLGPIVFKDADLRRRLETIIHPEVFRMFEEQRDRILSAEGDVLILFSAALLIETGYHSRMDRVIVVYAPEEEQLHRLIQRNNLSPAQALERIKAQISIEAKKPMADHVIDNSGSLADTRRQVETLLPKLHSSEADN